MSKKDILDKIDDYKTTIQAIVGFINFYRYDDQNDDFRTDILVFQGRRFTPSSGKARNEQGNDIKFVCPDFGVSLSSDSGVLGEVKKSFPKDSQRWMDDFKQLMSYDDDLTGWPPTNGKVASHDVILILEQARAVPVREFFEERNGKEITFGRPFVIVEFNRSDEGQPYYFFRKCLGNLSETHLDGRLKDGIKVPMEKLVQVYSEIQMYDDEPPLPYMVYLIWQNVVLNAASDKPSFSKLRKNQKMEIEFEVEGIAEELHKGFSFHRLHEDDWERQPKVPRLEWVVRACQALVDAGEAEWLDEKNVRIFFRKYDDVLDHFVELWSKGVVSEQRSLFDDVPK